MTHWTTGQRLVLYRALTLCATALIAHGALVWALPRLVMRQVTHGALAQTMDMHNKAAFPPAVDASSRQIVMPSPDMLYAVCVFDVSLGPVRVQAQPALTTYWSIALYGANSDNFFVVNDREVGDGTVDLWLVSQGSNPSAPAVPPGATVVVVPSETGLVLMRVLTGNDGAQPSVVEKARRTLACHQA